MRKIAVATAIGGRIDEHGEREPPVEDEQDHRGDEQGQRVLDEARDAVGDELVERLHVVGQAADDHARAVPLVEAEREPLEVAEQRVAQVGEDALARPAREVRLRVARRPVQDAREDERGDDPGELRQVVRLDPVVDRELGEERRPSAVAVAASSEPTARLVRSLYGRASCASVESAPAVRCHDQSRDLGAALGREVAAGLPDPHAVASRFSMNCASSRPCS